MGDRNGVQNFSSSNDKRCFVGLLSGMANDICELLHRIGAQVGGAAKSPGSAWKLRAASEAINRVFRW
jgi:hypothetical protein